MGGWVGRQELPCHMTWMNLKTLLFGHWYAVRCVQYGNAVPQILC
jgi:hypothetical protein